MEPLSQSFENLATGAVETADGYQVKLFCKKNVAVNREAVKVCGLSSLCYRLFS